MIGILFAIGILVLYIIAGAIAEIIEERRSVRRCVKKYNELHKDEGVTRDKE